MDTRKSSAPRAPIDPKIKLAKLEEQLAHELLPDEEREMLRDRVLGFRRKLRYARGQEADRAEGHID